MESKWSKDPVVTPPKIDITNPITSFVYSKLKETVSFPSSNDGGGIGGFSPKRECEQTQDGTKNNETWCRKK
jgi:hypothetical protein